MAHHLDDGAEDGCRAPHRALVPGDEEMDVRPVRFEIPIHVGAAHGGGHDLESRRREAPDPADLRCLRDVEGEYEDSGHAFRPERMSRIGTCRMLLSRANPARSISHKAHTIKSFRSLTHSKVD